MVKHHYKVNKKNEVLELTEEQVEFVKQVTCIDCTEIALKHFVDICIRNLVSPESILHPISKVTWMKNREQDN